MGASIETQLDSARSFVKNQQLAEAESAYRNILQSPPGTSTNAIATQETALYELGKLYQEHGYDYLSGKKK